MSLVPGTRLGPYEVVARAGAGGMGEVYRARDTRLDRTVAIKVLPSALAADASLRDRFEREARAISSLQHPHICALFDVGEAPGDSTTPDGRHLMLLRSLGTQGSIDLWALPLFGDRKPWPYLQTPADDADASFSNDGKWVAYQSNETGRNNIYVEAFPVRSGRRQVSTAGGSNPFWRADGRELFYVAADGRLMAVETDTGSGLKLGLPRPLFQLRLRPGMNGRQFSPTRDGQRFIVNLPDEQSAATLLTVVVNWSEELKQRVPTR